MVADTERAGFPADRGGRRAVHNILIVEDSPTMRALLTAALEDLEEGVKITEAESGFEALRQLPRGRYDLILTDINMPDINGLELIRFMRSTDAHRGTRLLIISSESSEKDRERGLSLGANAWLAKPFSADALIASVRGLLAGDGTETGGEDREA